ncbi:hypothetical protein MUK42_15908 [Musa troglodytarum]|uniref:Uncharacterized protein n=1 Tax=Musa troglodytarum TaxID=320322 RepID=A0A9E7L533_9LILI|nr:hypothetical protein MUK42_15908 [Musa troglodytarum]URE38345.1 hypothetical protein MUK42_15908 [Musa troglodytarum]
MGFGPDSIPKRGNGSNAGRYKEGDMNRGVGGPLLCIGDLLSDVAEDGDAIDGDGRETDLLPSAPAGLPPSPHLLTPSRDLVQVFQEDYDRLIQSLEGTDHSWTALTLKLCAALKTADKLVSSANSNIGSLLEKVVLLESIIKRGDSAVAMIESIQNVRTSKGGSSTINLDAKM